MTKTQTPFWKDPAWWGEVKAGGVESINGVVSEVRDVLIGAGNNIATVAKRVVTAEKTLADIRTIVYANSHTDSDKIAAIRVMLDKQ